MSSDSSSFANLTYLLVLLFFIALFPYVLRMKQKKSTFVAQKTSTQVYEYKISLKDFTTLMNNICHFLYKNKMGKPYTLLELTKEYVIVYTITSGSDHVPQTRGVLNDINKTVKVFHKDLQPTSFVEVNGTFEMTRNTFLSSDIHDLPPMHLFF